MIQLILNSAEKESALWIKIKSHLETKLDSARKQNDADLTLEQTAKQRGRIMEIKSFLALENLPPSFKQGDD